MKIQYVFIAAILWSFIACKDDQTNMVQGYKYKIHSSSKEKAKPTIGDFVYFNLTIADQKDSVLQRMDKYPDIPQIQIPTDEQMDDMPNPIAGLLKLLAVEDSATLYLPIDSFKNLPLDLPNMTEIRYHVVVKEIMSEEEYQQNLERQQEEKMAQATELRKRLPEITQIVEDFARDYKRGRAEFQTLASGLRIKILDEGEGNTINAGEMASVHYYGALVDGSPFDNSFNRGDPFVFHVGSGQVIRGWDEGLQQLKNKSKALLLIPSDLGYGATGSPPNIPGNAELIFYVEVEVVL
ncbi:MAG TPA: FKBP-type peptidyl-prolyl cis-trans isomerase [Saprospiraceae bacterium]|nr:FKBP-type peptidyl-prolyl cis-trans isomerase [Saprospiraceae bacterium]